MQGTEISNQSERIYSIRPQQGSANKSTTRQICIRYRKKESEEIVHCEVKHTRKKNIQEELREQFILSQL